MKCSEIMTQNPKMCVPEDNVTVPINIMWDFDCGCVPVVKDLESKELVGLVTDRDIAMGVVRFASGYPSEKKVSESMTSHVITCQAEDSLETAIKAMSENQIRRIPIVDEKGCCIGIISQANLLLHSTDIKDMKPIIEVLKQVSAPYSNNSENQKESAKPADIPDTTEETLKITAKDKTSVAV
jgi:CBS domain-containing protein